MFSEFITRLWSNFLKYNVSWKLIQWSEKDWVNWKSEEEYEARVLEDNVALKNVLCGWKRRKEKQWKEQNFKIRKTSERSEKKKITSTKKYWKRTPSNKQRWKKK